MYSDQTTGLDGECCCCPCGNRPAAGPGPVLLVGDCNGDDVVETADGATVTGERGAELTFPGDVGDAGLQLKLAVAVGDADPLAAAGMPLCPEPLSRDDDGFSKTSSLSETGATPRDINGVLGVGDVGEAGTEPGEGDVVSELRAAGCVGDAGGWWLLTA